MIEAHRNSLAHLERTLADLGSDDRLRRYKKNVPFVHIPIELAAQCHEYADLLRRHAWYRALFDADEIRAMSALFAAVRGYIRPDRVLDVDDGVLDDPAWRTIMGVARSLHARLVASGRIEPAMW